MTARLFAWLASWLAGVCMGLWLAGSIWWALAVACWSLACCVLAVVRR